VDKLLKPTGLVLQRPVGSKISADAKQAVVRSIKPRRFDPRALAQLESFAVRLINMLCAATAVTFLEQFWELSGIGTFFQWRLWALLFPIGIALMPFQRTSGFADAQTNQALSLIRTILQSVCVVVSVQTLLWMSNIQTNSTVLLLALVLVYFVLACMAQALFFRLTRPWHRKLRVAIVGVGDQGSAIATHLNKSAETIEIVGFFDDRINRIEANNLTPPFLGTVAELCAKHDEIDVVMLAIQNNATNRIEGLTSFIRKSVLDVYLAPEATLLHLASRPNIGSPLDPGLCLNLNRLTLSDRILKRLFDIGFSIAAIVLTLPLCLCIAVLIKLESPGPVIFKQPRYGRGNYLFNVYKFRSMAFDPTPNAAEIRLTERSDSRVTRVGSFLRRSSLDELPQFLNVLLGDMSVVGPRPHPPGVKAGQRMYEEVVPRFMERYTIRPGITGWAQVMGLRGNTFTEQDVTNRFARDVEYIRKWSIEFDLWIILKTIKGGFGGKNAF
jgi:polysaccharide biosynthesis protein PslA